MKFIRLIFMILSVLLITVNLHEMAHFGAGKLFKAKIESYSIGFGGESSAILTVKGKDGVRYQLTPYLLGGYVEFSEKKEQAVISPDEVYISDLSFIKRALISVAGVFANFLSYIFLMLYVFKKESFKILLTKDGKKTSSYRLFTNNTNEKFSLSTAPIKNWVMMQFLTDKKMPLFYEVFAFPRRSDETIHENDHVRELTLEILKKNKVEPEDKDKFISYYGYISRAQLPDFKDEEQENAVVSQKNAKDYLNLIVFYSLYLLQSFKEKLKKAFYLKYNYLPIFYSKKYSYPLALAYTSLMLAVFNLLPLIPLDGGRLFLDFLLSLGLDKSSSIISLYLILSQPLLLFLFIRINFEAPEKVKKISENNLIP